MILKTAVFFLVALFRANFLSQFPHPLTQFLGVNELGWGKTPRTKNVYLVNTYRLKPNNTHKYQYFKTPPWGANGKSPRATINDFRLRAAPFENTIGPPIPEGGGILIILATKQSLLNILSKKLIRVIVSIVLWKICCYLCHNPLSKKHFFKHPVSQQVLKIDPSVPYDFLP